MENENEDLNYLRFLNERSSDATNQAREYEQSLSKLAEDSNPVWC